MEYFDVLDRDGNPTGVIKARGSAFNKGEYYRGVHAYVCNGAGEFLLQRRALDKKFLPGGWDITLGHVMAGETSRQGMLRELREELGLTVTEDDLHFVGSILWPEYSHFADIYFVRTDAGLCDLILQEEEVIGAKYVSLDEMRGLVASWDYRSEPYKRLVLAALDRLA